MGTFRGAVLINQAGSTSVRPILDPTHGLLAQRARLIQIHPLRPVLFDPAARGAIPRPVDERIKRIFDCPGIVVSHTCSVPSGLVSCDRPERSAFELRRGIRPRTVTDACLPLSPPLVHDSVDR